MYFVISPDISWLWKWIGGVASERYKDWKYECRMHWKNYGKEVPMEFTDRRDQWKWLVSHFDDPAQKVRKSIYQIDFV